MNLTIYDVSVEYLKELTKWDMKIAPSSKMVKRLANNFDSLVMRADIRRGPIKNMQFANIMMAGLEEFYQCVVEATEKVPLAERQEAVIEVIAHYPFPDVDMIKDFALIFVEVWKNTLIEMTPRNMSASVGASINFVLSGVNTGLKTMPSVGRFDLNVAQALTASIAVAIIWRALITAVELKQKGEF